MPGSQIQLSTVKDLAIKRIDMMNRLAAHNIPLQIENEVSTIEREINLARSVSQIELSFSKFDKTIAQIIASQTELKKPRKKSKLIKKKGINLENLPSIDVNAELPPLYDFDIELLKEGPIPFIIPDNFEWNGISNSYQR